MNVFGDESQGAVEGEAEAKSEGGKMRLYRRWGQRKSARRREGRRGGTRGDRGLEITVSHQQSVVRAEVKSHGVQQSAADTAAL